MHGTGHIRILGDMTMVQAQFSSRTVSSAWVVWVFPRKALHIWCDFHRASSL